ncbi:MAG: methyltransferase domain-containing protein, partial [Gemmatimonadetes bacterium]|nr:methyltransferase domain-containing protein [Gemmatimonadota bacterium]
PGTPEFGAAFETWLLHELIAFRDYVSGETVAHWRSSSGFEVDFILGDHTAIEVKAKETVSDRDLRSLGALAEEKKLKRSGPVNSRRDFRRYTLRAGRGTASSGPTSPRMDLRERTENPNRHPWELSRADMALRLLALRAKHGGHTSYADVGAGDRYFARRLAALTDAPVFAVDANYPEATVDGPVVVCTDLAQVPAGSVDCAVLMDVLEHVDDDVGLVRDVNRILTPDGELLITVPAHQWLWSEHDVFLGHRRRYDGRRLRDVLRHGGLDVLECFHFYALLGVARAAGVALARLGVRRSAHGVGRWPLASTHPATRTLRATLNADFRISRRLGTTPLGACGLSICAICRRRSA